MWNPVNFIRSFFTSRKPAEQPPEETGENILQDYIDIKVDDNVGEVDKIDNGLQPKPFTYKRSNRFREILDSIQARENAEVPLLKIVRTM